MFYDVVLYIFLILILGYICKQIGILNNNRINILNKIAFYVALPALVFHSIYKRPLDKIFSPPLLAGFLATILLMVIVSWKVHSKTEKREKRSVGIVQSYHGNIGYMGLPVVSKALGSAAGAKASLLLGFGSITQILMTMAIFAYINSAKAKFSQEVKRIFLNPVVISLLFGIAISIVGISPPKTIDTALSWISESALPIALLGVGASIEMKRRFDDLKTVSSVLGLKIIMMPVIGWILLSLLGVGELGIESGVLMLGMPTAVSTFIYAKELGGNGELASLNISTTTLASVASITALLYIFG